MNEPTQYLWAYSLLYYKDGKIENKLGFRPASSSDEVIGWVLRNLMPPVNSLIGVWVESAPDLSLCGVEGKP